MFATKSSNEDDTFDIFAWMDPVEYAVLKRDTAPLVKWLSGVNEERIRSIPILRQQVVYSSEANLSPELDDSPEANISTDSDGDSIHC